MTSTALWYTLVLYLLTLSPFVDHLRPFAHQTMRHGKDGDLED